MAAGGRAEDRETRTGPWSCPAASAAGPLAVLVAFVVALVATGSPVYDVGAWLAVVVTGVLLPGFVLTRATRRQPVALGDDLAWSVPVGCLVGMAGWAVDLLVPVPGWAWGLLVTAAAVAWPAARRRALTPSHGRWGSWSTLSVSGVLVLALAWMTREYLKWTPVDPGPHGHLYPDTMYQLALVSELGRTALPQYPMVAGEPLGYHWFLYALEHHLLAGSGIDRLDLVLRLIPVSLLLGAMVMVAAIARQVAGRAVAGPIAVAFVGLVGASTATRWLPTGVGFSMVNNFWWSGTPQTFGWIAGLAVLATGVALIRRSPADRAAPVVFLPLFTALTAGAKSSMLPVLVCGFALATGVAVLQRDRRQAARAALVTGLIVLVTVAAIFTVYRSQSYGLRIAPGEGLQTIAGGLFPGLIETDPSQPYLMQNHLPGAAVLATTLLWLVPQLVRWLGIGWLVRCRAHDPATWVTLGCGIGGVLAVLVLRHPGSSEAYFTISAFPVVAVGSAAGLAAVLPRGPALRRWLLAGAGALAFGAVSALVVSLAAGGHSPLVGWQARFDARPLAAQVSELGQIWGWSWPLVTVSALAVALAVAVWVGSRSSRVALLTGFTALLGVGCFATAALVVGADPPTLPQAYASSGSNRPPALTRDLLTAGDWLRAHARSTDVVAVNRACVSSSNQRCSAQQFTVTAATGLRSDVDGWAFAGRNVQAAWDSDTTRYPFLPFWDQARLDRELQAFTAPRATAYAELYADGVRWLLADRPSPALPTTQIDALADRELTLGTVLVWRLRPPTG
ncbi:MAG: hypothetical protein M3P23_06655 [Actinomycetota bacterium]|nr:hypothetical protein [Actinomycetota bacterium]